LTDWVLPSGLNRLTLRVSCPVPQKRNLRRETDDKNNDKNNANIINIFFNIFFNIFINNPVLQLGY
jgi:hypothetical protein